MATADARQRIVDFLEQQLFQPVLDSNPDDHPPFRRGQVEEVRGGVAHERDGIRAAISAEAAVRGFNEAVERSAANGLDERLRGLERRPSPRPMRNWRSSRQSWQSALVPSR